MFKVKQYDLGDVIEKVGFYSDVVDSIVESKNLGIFKEKKTNYGEYTLEQKQELNKERSLSRSKTKIRRLCQRFNMRYMWTFTFAKKDVVTYNPVNKKTSTYDAGNYDDVWKLWKGFLKRAQRAGLNFEYVCTVEVQEERLQETGEKIYHFHFITNKRIPKTKEQAKKQGSTVYMDMLWTHGYTFVSFKKSKKKIAHFYVVKYLSKLIDEIGLRKQRYRVSEGMEIPCEVVMYGNHVDMFKDSNEILTSNYSVVGDCLEIFWLITKKTKIKFRELLT